MAAHFIRTSNVIHTSATGSGGLGVAGNVTSFDGSGANFLTAAPVIHHEPHHGQLIHHNLAEGFVGVHIGAGQHSEAKTSIYFQICAAACQAAVQVLREGGTASDAAEAATIVLEDAGETNAGYGSNLTEDGTVEMDAGFMDGGSLVFGSVGAVSGVKNPIRVARKLVEEQKKGLLPMGRVPPSFLVGDGARVWAERHGIPSVSDEKLVSKKSAKLYKHYKRKLDTYNNGGEQLLQEETPPSHKKRRVLVSEDTAAGSIVGELEEVEVFTTDHPHHASLTQEAVNNAVRSITVAAQPTIVVTQQQQTAAGVIHHIPTEYHFAEAPDRPGEEWILCENLPGVGEEVMIAQLDDKVTDTVGVVVLDRKGNVASTVSSGGIALKQPGRVGQAACHGCGCWAQGQIESPAGPTKTVAVSTTGCGEHLTRVLLAKECAQGLAHSTRPGEDLQHIMKDKFVKSPFLEGVPIKLGGAICLQYDRDTNEGHFLWTHTTASMGIGFQSTSENEPKLKMSRLPKNPRLQGTHTVLVDSIGFNTSTH